MRIEAEMRELTGDTIPLFGVCCGAHRGLRFEFAGGSIASQTRTPCVTTMPMTRRYLLSQGSMYRAAVRLAYVNLPIVVGQYCSYELTRSFLAEAPTLR